MTERSTSEKLEQRITDMNPGNHLCFIYETQEEHRAVLTPFLRQGLDRGEKVLYVVDNHTEQDILNYMRDDGVVVEPYLESRQLMILNVNETYMQKGIFDPDDVITLLQKETERALDEGYSNLRVSGEATWALQGLPGSDRLIEYETKINEFFAGSACLAICQYDKRRFQPNILLDILITHPVAIIGTEIFDNFYYVPAKDLLGPNPEVAKLTNWVDNLLKHKRAERVLKAREKEVVRKTRDLKEMNAALRVLLKKREVDKQELEEKVLSNIKQLIEPYLGRLKRSKLDERQKDYIDVLESNLRDIISPFSRSLSSRYLSLTRAEIQVAKLIKQGKTTKEIAELLNLSRDTVGFHRLNIREKLGIKRKKANLRTHILSLQE